MNHKGSIFSAIVVVVFIFISGIFWCSNNFNWNCKISKELRGKDNEQNNQPVGNTYNEYTYNSVSAVFFKKCYWKILINKGCTIVNGYSYESSLFR